MPLVSDTIPNLINGISQQPQPLRLPSQGDVQDNFISSVQDGLGKRPGTRHVAKLTSAAWEGAFFHTINRDSSEQYGVVVAGGDLKVYDLHTGAAKTVNFPNGKAYLTSTTSFRAVTVADYTFLVNQSVVPAMTSHVVPTPNPTQLIGVAVGEQGRDYRILLDNVEVAYYQTVVAGPSTGTEFAVKAGAEYIATKLKEGLDANLGSTFATWRKGHVIRVRRTNSTPFNLRAEDGAGGNNLRIISDEVQSFSALPAYGITGFKTKIVGAEGSSSFDDYWVTYESDSADDGAGVWKESIGPGTPYRLDAATMPHVLIREADGTFTFKRAPWDDLKVGDSESCPPPSFVGSPIADVFFFRNRLGFITGEGAVMSRSGHFFDFWPQSASEVLDSDRVDLKTAHTKVSLLHHAVPFNKTLLLFSDQTQFVLDGGDLLTPKSASILPTTEYEGSSEARPVGAGRHVYFPVNRGEFSGLREYATDRTTDTEQALDTTTHVQRYVPSNIVELRAATNEDMVTALSASDPSSIYVYRFYWSDNNEKLQSSWSRWTFGGAVLSHAFIGSRLLIVARRAGGVYLEEMDVSAGAVSPGSSILYRCDRQLFETDLPTPVYADGVTTWTLPFTAGDLWAFVRAGDADKVEGLTLTHTRPSGNTISIAGNHVTRKVCFGEKVLARYRFSTIFVREGTAQSGTKSISDGRLQLGRMYLDYARTGYFTVTVRPEGRSTYVYTFEAKRLGISHLDQLSVLDGRFRVPVRARNTEAEIEIVTDHYLPAFFLGAEWEGQFHLRSRRI